MKEYDYEIVDQFYAGNSDEELIMHAQNLKAGMIVLVADPKRRSNIIGRVFKEGTDSRAEEDHNIGKTNRWCRVSDPTIVNTTSALAGRRIHFFGTYANGDMLLRKSRLLDTWYVKKESLPEPTDQRVWAANLEASTALLERLLFEVGMPGVDTSQMINKAASRFADMFEATPKMTADEALFECRVNQVENLIKILGTSTKKVRDTSEQIVKLFMIHQ